MRILHISSARSLGGGERHLADLVNSLSSRGHEVFVALPALSPLRQELRSLPSKNVLTLRLRNALDIGSTFELSRLLREHQIEILHAHVARDYPLAALATKRNQQTKLIITRHVLFPLGALHAFTMSHVARVIAVSTAVRRSLVENKSFPEEKLTVIQNGIDLPRFDLSLRTTSRNTSRLEMSLEPETFLIGTVGDIRSQKGHEDFVAAAARIAHQRSDIHFLVAGADTTRKKDHMRSLEQLVRDLELETRVHFAGWVSDTAPFLAALDVYVSASRTESFGLATVEAMASGLPIVATETEGARETLEHELTGILVPVGDVEALASSSMRLIEDPFERMRLGSASRTAAQTRFSLERMVEETEKVYMEAISAT